MTDPPGPLETQVVSGDMTKVGFPKWSSVVAWVAQSYPSIRYEIIYVI